MNDLKESLESLDIGEWMDAQGVEYRKTRGSSGDQYNVKECPACGNSKWKTYLNTQSGLGNCFVCNYGYNKWKFISAVLSDLSTSRAVESIKSFTEGRIWRPKAAKRAPVATVTPDDLELPESYALPYRGQNMKYLEDRGVDADLARYFQLRYCNAGYYRYRAGGDWRFMVFNERIIIPVFDLAGKLVTFQGRDVTGTADRKYLFPAGLQSSGTLLYNGQNVTMGTKAVVVGEGAFDVIAIKKAFDESSDFDGVIPVGTFGKHLSWGTPESQQWKFYELRQRGVDTITIMWDGELQATRDALKAARQLIVLGFRVKIAMLPFGKDPNEVSADTVRSAYANATPFTPLSEIKLMMQRQSEAV